MCYPLGNKGSGSVARHHPSRWIDILKIRKSVDGGSSRTFFVALAHGLCPADDPEVKKLSILDFLIQGTKYSVTVYEYKAPFSGALNPFMTLVFFRHHPTISFRYVKIIHNS